MQTQELIVNSIRTYIFMYKAIKTKDYLRQAKEQLKFLREFKQFKTHGEHTIETVFVEFVKAGLI